MGVVSKSPASGIRASNCKPGGGDGVLPFPMLPPEALGAIHDLSRGVAQRVARRVAVHQRASDSISAINALAGFSTPIDSQNEMSPGQARVWRRACSLHSQEGPPLSASNSKEALRELLGAAPSS